MAVRSVVFIFINGTPLQKVVAVLLSAEPQLEDRHHASHSQVVAWAENQHVLKMLEGVLGSRLRTYFEKCVSSTKPCLQVSSCGNYSSKVPYAIGENVCRQEGWVERIGSEGGLLTLKRFPRL